MTLALLPGCETTVTRSPSSETAAGEGFDDDFPDHATTVTTALIMAPAGPRGARWRDECFEYCQRHGYEVAGVVPADVAGWRAAMEAWLTGRVDVLVVARDSHIPPDRVPRVEIVAREEPYRRRPGDRRRRPTNGTRPG